MECFLFPASCVVWLDGYLVLGGESGDVHVWEADTLRDIARHKAHSGIVIIMYTCIIHTSTAGAVLLYYYASTLYAYIPILFYCVVILQVL